MGLQATAFASMLVGVVAIILLQAVNNTSFYGRPYRMEASNRAYDVFLSHRGPDKKDFCAFLKEALHRAGVHAFVDEHDLEVGAPEMAWTTMLKELQGARYVVPVISHGYVESRWCLDELVLMMQSPAKVMPVFFDVPPEKDMLADLLSRCDAFIMVCMHMLVVFCCPIWLLTFLGLTLPLPLQGRAEGQQP